MRLYLSAHSEKKIGYTPDWIRVTFEEEGARYELTLDIQGMIDYSKDTLDCRCKGELVPWTLYDLESGAETDLSSMTETEVEERFPDEYIASCFCKSQTFEVGRYPAAEEVTYETAANDTLSNCEGFFEAYPDFTKEFSFIVENNM